MPPGHPLPGGAPAPTFAQPYPFPASRSLTNPASDLLALGSVKIAAVLGLVSACIGLLNLFAGQTTGLITTNTTSAGTTYALNYGVLYFVAAEAAIGLAILVVELLLYRRAFRALDPIDPGFGTPSTMVLLALISVVLLIVTVGGLLGLLVQTIACAGTSSTLPPGCVNLALLLVLLGVVVVLAILALIGTIGLLIGIWRLGGRYNEGMFKAGAILLIFPVLNLVGLVLIILGARSAERGIRSGTAPRGF